MERLILRILAGLLIWHDRHLFPDPGRGNKRAEFDPSPMLAGLAIFMLLVTTLALFR
jgi:hypothetical protein